MSLFRKKLTNITNFLTGGNRSFSPERDWKIIFISSLLVFILSLVFHVFFFYQINNESIFRSNITVSDDTLEQGVERLDQAFNFFEGKRKRFEIIKERGVTTFDPSV